MATRQRFLELVNSLGRSALNALYPDDFEYYVLTFELVDSRENSLDYITFPVNPDAFSESEIPLTTVKKTAGGVTAYSNDTFVPKMINLSGSFGRRFRLLLGAISTSAVIDQANAVFGRGSGGGSGATVNNRQFSINLKTGYGVIKKIEKMIKRHNTLDEFGEPHKLYMYNLMNNNNYLVEPMSFDMFQDKGEANMIWNYNMSLTAIAPVDQVATDTRELFSISSREAVQKTSNRILYDIRRLI